MELAEMIEKIRGIRDINPGDTQPDDSDFGEVGQMIENLLFNEPGSWEEVDRNPNLRIRVIDGTKMYLESLTVAKAK